MAFNLSDFLAGAVKSGVQGASNLVGRSGGAGVYGLPLEAGSLLGQRTQNLYTNPAMVGGSLAQSLAVPQAQAAAVQPPPPQVSQDKDLDSFLSKAAFKVAEKRFAKDLDKGFESGQISPEQIMQASMNMNRNQQTQQQGPVAGPGQAFFGQGQPGSAVGMEIPGQQMTQPQQSGLGRVLRGLGSLTGLDASKGLMQTARVDERGNYIPGSSFFGLLQEPSSSQLQAQQAYNLQPDVQLAQKIREAELVPLAKARKEELGIAGQNEFFKSVFGTAKGSAPSAESVKLGALSTNALDQLNLLNTTFQKDPDFFKNVNIPGNPKGQILDTIINDLSDSIGRLRSGGAITADEEKRFLSNLPKKGLKGYTEDAETIKFKLARATNMFSGINSALTTKNVLGENIKKALAAGASREQIYRVLGGGQ